MTEQNLYEIESIRDFVVQAINRADPTLDTSPGSPLDAELVTPLVTRLGPDPYDTPVRDFILARLRAEYPAMVIQDGDLMDDYAVKIMQILLEPFRRQVRTISRSQSTSNASTMTDEEADNLAANFFVRRREGSYSVGIARLYFSSPQSVIVTPSNAISTGGGLKFFPVETQAMTSDVMQMSTESGLFFFDVVVRAENRGSEYNIDPGTLASVSNMGSVVKVTNRSGFEEGADKETTEEFLARTEESLNEKSLVTARGISSRLKDTFENIQALQVVGFGDPEMDRDIVTAAAPAVTESYAVGVCTVGTGVDSDLVTVSSIASLNGGSTLQSAGVVAGDTVLRSTNSGGFTTNEVESVIDSTRFRVKDPYPDGGAALRNFIIQHEVVGQTPSLIELSNIPGGIIAPTTSSGAVEVVPGQVHIGGALDVYVRAGFPQERSTNLQSIQDAEPLNYGIDLETFGENSDEFVEVTDLITNGVKTEAGYSILVYLSGTNSAIKWYPTSDDVGRFIQLRGGSSNNHGTFEILEVKNRVVSGSAMAIRVQLKSTNEEGSAVTWTAAQTHSFRVKIKVSVKMLVRDRSNVNSPAGTDFSLLGVEVGDSVVIETGDDADIYTAKRVLDSGGSSDTLVLDTELTKTVTPSGSGNGTGRRYRVSNSLTIDLMNPRTMKIPLGSIWAGNDLSSVAASKELRSSGGSNFILAGVSTGDTVEILEGSNKGRYLIEAVSSSQVTVTQAMPSTEFNMEFQVYTAFNSVERPMVRVSEVELLDSASQGTGVLVPYGDCVDVRVLGKLSNRASGQEVYSSTGAITGATIFKDLDVDFVEEGVVPGYRLNIQNGVSAGSYIVKSVSENTLSIYGLADGGSDFSATYASVRYTMGLPSSGYARLYFIQPTSVEILTGVPGARLSWTDGVVTKEFLFSEVEGRTILPAASSGDDQPRDLRLVKRDYVSGHYDSVIELTGGVDVYDLELMENDIVDAYSPIFLRDVAGNIVNFYGSLENETVNYFAGAPGVMTVAGSDIVRLPEFSSVKRSSVDFQGMDEEASLLGHRFFIDSGDDTGEYQVEEVVSSGHLRLNAAMKGSTSTVTAAGVTGVITDLGDDGQFSSPGLGFLASNRYVTLYEITVSDHESMAGSWLISEVIDNDTVVLKDVCKNVTSGLSSGTFKWVQSIGATPTVPFSLYESSPVSLLVTEVAPKSSTKTAIFDCHNNTYTALSVDGMTLPAISNGDQVSIFYGPNKGVYLVESATVNSIILKSTTPLPTLQLQMRGRVYGGIYGCRSMVKVTEYQGNGGMLPHGVSIPYTVKRPAVLRISSTEMSESQSGGLFYLDAQIESLESGDSLNLDSGKKLTLQPSSAVRIDGYTYDVDNPSLTFSPYEETSIRFDRRILPEGNSDLPENMLGIANRNMQIRYEMSSTVRVVDDLLRSDFERPVNANPIGRHFLPQYVILDLYYQGGSSPSVVSPEIEDFINNTSATGSLEVSDIESMIHRRGATYIRHPIEIVVITHGTDRKLIADRSVDKINEDTVSYRGSARTSTFFAKVGDGLTISRG